MLIIHNNIINAYTDKYFENFDVWWEFERVGYSDFFLFKDFLFKLIIKIVAYWLNIEIW